MKKILLVGCGHMGTALLNAWFKKKSFLISIIDPKTYKSLNKKYSGRKISIYKSINQIKKLEQFNVIVFAVKPQIAKEVVSEFNYLKNKNILFISIIAGKKINFFTKHLVYPHSIIRAMPNMPALVEKGMTCFVSNNLTNKSQKLLASKLFKVVGKVIWLNEELDIDKITAISGSGPAYYFLFIEQIISEAIKLGLKKSVAKELVYQTALGSIHMLHKSERSAEELKKIIAVKGGTTEAAINVFENKSKFRTIISKALKAAFNKSKKLGNN